MIKLRGFISTVAELFQFLWHRRLWWLMPMIVVLLLFAAVIVLASTTGVGPLIYTLF